MLSEIGEMVFSIVIGYMGALEFLYVVRHLYHWSFQHPEECENDDEKLKRLQEQLRNAINIAKSVETASGTKAMKDGILYKDGFRIDSNQEDIEKLKNQINDLEKNQKRRREIEAELARQKKIEEETRDQLKKAEEELARQRQKAEEDARKQEEDNARKLLEAERARESEQRKLEEEQRRDEENARKLFEKENQRKLEEQREAEENARRIREAEREREMEQRKLEEQREAEENARKMQEAEKEREMKQRKLEEQREAEENSRRMQEAEREREMEQRKLEEQRETEENYRRMQEAENERVMEQRKLEEQQEAEENARRIREAEKEREMEQRKIEEQREAEENSRRIREAEIEHETLREAEENAERLMEIERQKESQQRYSEMQLEDEENTQKLLEVERNNETIQRQLIEEGQKREMANILQLIESERATEDERQIVDKEALHKLKTAKDEVELRQHISYDDNAIEVQEEPCIKKIVKRATAQNAEEDPENRTTNQTVKTQYGQTSSDSYPTKSKAETVETVDMPSIHFDEYERQAPDGEDLPSLQYSDEYLRSLDGIKSKPLVREDGSGRRRAFKKRRSSGSSTSSRESRASREEELKMFTSLEEEEFETIRKGESEYSAIKYSSDPNLKVTKQHRRHKRSPAKDTRRDLTDDGSGRGSLEMLDEEGSNPWGEVKPEHYKNSEFWKREKTISIEEELDDKETIETIAARNITVTASFEEVTTAQNEEAIAVLPETHSKDDDDQQTMSKHENEATMDDSKKGNNSNT